MMIPKTDDGRVLFVILWNDKLLLGTTDTPINEVTLEPKPLKEEINFIINHFNRCAKSQISYSDVKSVFVGLRPLAKVGSEKKTALLSREHVIRVFPSGLVDVAGGKWNTYRNMAEQTINKAIKTADLKFVRCKTRHLKIHGYSKKKNISHLSVYGADAYFIQQMMDGDVSLREKRIKTKSCGEIFKYGYLCFKILSQCKILILRS